jgi:hypothetical protein
MSYYNLCGIGSQHSNNISKGKLEGEVTSLSETSQGEVGDNREKWGDFWEKLIAISRNIVSRPL